MRDFDWSLPYASRRSPVLARNVVAASQPLAAQAGLSLIARGGSAADAAIGAAIALTVVEPTNNGVGSDAFALVWDEDRIAGLNASGRSPAAWAAEKFAGETAMPATGWGSVTVPGAVSGWVELWRRFGRLPFAKLFEPAIAYARDGFPVSPIVARHWALQGPLLAGNSAFAATFLPNGRTPVTGETFRSEELARTLEEIATTEGESFYRGELARRIAATARAEGGALSAGDLADHRADWVEPLQVEFHGARLHELPPNTQGLAALIALGILARLPLAEHDVDSVDAVHLEIEAMKLALGDVRRHVGDPAAMTVEPASLLEASHLDRRAALVDSHRARPLEAAGTAAGDTVYLATADATGQMVSYIQSNYFGFGSGVVVPGTAISMQNRGSGFSLEPGHPNIVRPRKRPFHTLIPGFATIGGQGCMSFGVMGGPMQAQGHVQMMVRIALHGQNPQAAADAPRWQVLGGVEVGVEPGFDAAAIEALRERGHSISVLDPTWFGGAQIICKGADGWVAASDPRKDGQAAGF